MKDMLRYGLILALICVLAAGLLATVNSLTKDRIIAQAKAEEQAALKEIMPQGEKFEPVNIKEELDYYKVFDKAGNFIGIVFKAKAKGYSSVIETLAGMFKDGKISAIKVISQNETPGLGVKITEAEFTSQFSKKGADLSQVDAISGATISSSAVIKSVRQKAQEIEGLLKNER